MSSTPPPSSTGDIPLFPPYVPETPPEEQGQEQVGFVARRSLFDAFGETGEDTSRPPEPLIRRARRSASAAPWLRRPRQPDSPTPVSRKARKLRPGSSSSSSKPQWVGKTAFLASGEISINGKSYPINALEGGKGCFHKVFAFACDEVISLDKVEVSTQDVVLKILNRGEVAANKEKEVIEGDVNGYHHLERLGIPVAKVYADPISFIDSANPMNGKFWIVEKMHTKISGDAWSGDVSYETLDQASQKILTWAKEQLSEMARQRKDLINDFRKRNTMLDKDGQPRIVDYSLPETDEDDIVMNIASYAMDWANDNPNILLYLTADFPEDLAVLAWNKLTEKLEG